MKTLLITSLFLLSGLTFASGNHEDHSKMNHSKHGSMNHSNEDVQGTDNKEFNKVLESYELLHQAFFENDNEKVQNQAKKLASTIDEIKDQKISETLSFTKKKLIEVAGNLDLEANKIAFGTISHGLLIVLEKHAPNKNYQGYYCPMVKKYWIQNISKSKDTMNPYKSETMPGCGGPKKMES